MSRKLIFASGLLICFSCQLDPELNNKISTGNDDINAKHLANHIWEAVSLTPLDILARWVDRLGVDAEVGKKLLTAYDEFMGLMADKSTRQALKQLAPRHSRTDSSFRLVRDISTRFEEGLRVLFFRNPSLQPLTEKYGVF